MHALRRRATFANIVSLIALFVALGGSSYAALRIGSKQIANNSVRGVDVRDNNLTGKDVRESRLGTVPNALHARTAGRADSGRHADNAAALDGQTPAQLRSGIDAATLGGLASGAFARKGRAAAIEEQITMSGFGFQALGGPEVTVEVGPSGLVAVYAEAEIQSDTGGGGATNRGTIGLFDNGAVVPGLRDCNGGGGALASVESTAGGFVLAMSGVDTGEADLCAGRRSYGHPIVFRTTPGQHTFELRYVSAIDGTTFLTRFRERVIAAAPLD